MIEINLMRQHRRTRVFAKPVALVLCAFAAALAVYSVAGYRAPTGPALSTEQKASARPAPSTKKPERSIRIRAAGFVRLGGAESALLVSGRKAQWVERGQSAFGFVISEIKEGGVLVSAETGRKKPRFLPIRR